MILSYCGVRELASFREQKSPHFLTRSIQQAWQLFQNMSIKAYPISLNSTLSLLFPVAEGKSTLSYTGFRVPSREACLCLERFSGEVTRAEWMQVYLFKPVAVKKTMSQQPSHHGRALNRIFTVALQLILLSACFQCSHMVASRYSQPNSRWRARTLSQAADHAPAVGVATPTSKAKEKELPPRWLGCRALSQSLSFLLLQLSDLSPWFTTRCHRPHPLPLRCSAREAEQEHNTDLQRVPRLRRALVMLCWD